MDENPVLVGMREGYRVLTLNRPQRLNAFTEAMHVALAAALKDAEADPSCRALLLTGAGRGFCAGQDLTDRLATGDTPALGGALENFYNPLVRKLRALPFPIVAAVNGVAAGAGANIALACDIVLAARSATFVQAFARIGLVPDSGGTWFLPRLVGSARARALALLAEPISAEQAVHQLPLPRKRRVVVKRFVEFRKIGGAQAAHRRHSFPSHLRNSPRPAKRPAPSTIGPQTCW